MANGTSVTSSGGYMPSRVWAIDAANVDFGVRIRLGLSGSRGATQCTAVTYIRPEEHYFGASVKAVNSTTGKAVSGAEFKVYARREVKDYKTLPSGFVRRSGSSYCWEPIAKLTYNSSTGRYENKNIRGCNGVNNYQIMEIKAPAGYAAVTVGSVFQEVKVLGSGQSYTGTLQRVDYGKTVNLQDIQNRPKPFGVSVKVADSVTGKPVSGAVVKVYARRDVKDYKTLPEGFIRRSGSSYCWEPIAKLTYNSSTGCYENKSVNICKGVSNYQVMVVDVPKGYASVKAGAVSHEVKVLSAADSYGGSLQRINYGQTATGKTLKISKQ